MNVKLFLCFWIFIGSFSIAENIEFDGEINTIEVGLQTMGAALSCIEWRAVGGCAWIKCRWLPVPSCNPTVTIRIKHYIPETLVQVYDRGFGEPWIESQLINSLAVSDADGLATKAALDISTSAGGYNQGYVEGGKSTSASPERVTNLRFKLVDVYGNPALPAFNNLLATYGLSCATSTKPFVPLFISNLDVAAWRFNTLERFFYQSSDVITRIFDLEDSLANNYGGIYPRHGFVTQHDDLKAAVLTAYRAMHFITRKNQGHVYLSIHQDNQEGFWAPDPLEKGAGRTGKWQMLYPDDEDSCREFPMGVKESANKRSQDGSYVWNFWREYECCKRGGQFYVGTISFDDM